MKRLLFALLLLPASALAEVPEHLKIRTAQDLYRVCETETEVHEAVCITYIAGALDSYFDLVNTVGGYGCYARYERQWAMHVQTFMLRNKNYSHKSPTDALFPAFQYVLNCQKLPGEGV